MRDRGEVFQRLDDLMKKSGRMEKELIEYIGLPVGTFSQWRRGNGDSYLRYIKEICNFFHVTPNYLFLGDDENHGQVYTKEETHILNAYRRADEREKKLIIALVNAIEE